MEDKIQLMIIEDETLIAEDIADLCEDIGYPPSFVAYRAGQAIDILKKNPIDLVLLDINLEDSIDGVDIAEFINKECTADFIFLTSYADQHTLKRVSATNPAGYIVKPFNKQQLQSTLILTINAKQKKSSPLTLEALNAFCKTSISEREFEIILLVYQGHSNATIAEKSFLSINTIKYHLKQIFLRLEVKSRMELLNLIRKVREQE